MGERVMLLATVTLEVSAIWRMDFIPGYAAAMAEPASEAMVMRVAIIERVSFVNN